MTTETCTTESGGTLSTGMMVWPDRASTVTGPPILIIDG